MSSALSWDVFDPAYTPGSPEETAGGEVTPISSSTGTSGMPFWHPNHELFGFGVLLALTAGAIYIATGGNAGARVKGEANLGGLDAEAGAGIGKEK